MARGTNLERVQDIKRALQRAKPGDQLSLTELALIWGIGKGAFVNVRERMAGFPTSTPGPGNSLLYPAIDALKAMLEHETRADAAEQERQKRAAAIMGMAGGRGRRKKAEEIHLSPSEMLKLSRLRAEIEDRERQQGLYVLRSKMEEKFGEVFGVISEWLGQLSLKCDPNGLWEPEERERVDIAGRQCLLLIHGEISDMLPPDADSGPRRTKKSRTAGNSTRPARTRRRSGGAGPK